MNLNKVTTFGPGQEFRLDKRVIFVEYESMTGELVKCRFDLSQKTEMIYNDHRILSFDDLTYLYSTDEEILIKRVLYYEQECHMVIGDKLLIPTKIYFENAGYQQAYETHNKLLLPNTNSAYGIASRDWGDVLAESARYIHMQRSRCNGKTLWLSSATSFADKQPLWNIATYHDICEQWIKEPPTPYEFIADDLDDCEKGVPNTKLIDPNKYLDTDMASSLQAKLMKSIENSKYGISFSDGDTVKKIKKFEEEIKMAEKTRFDMYKPTIKNVIFNDPATIVMWSDGTKTVVKCGEDDTFDPEKGIAMCCMKKLLGTNKTGSNYLDKVEKYFDKYDEDYIEECKTVGEILKEIWGDAFGPTHLPVPDVNTDTMDIPPEVTVEKEFEAVTSNDWTVVPADENTTAEEDGE